MKQGIALKIFTVLTLLIGLITLALFASKNANRPSELGCTLVEKEEIIEQDGENAVLTSRDFFVIVFAYDAKGIFRKPVQSHVFALFYEAKNGTVCRDFGISWRPAGQLQMGLSEGKNLGVKETIAQATQDGLEVQMWGPYAVQEKTYRNAELRFQDLVAGKYYYRNWDAPNRTDLNRPALNNVHAISDIAGCIDTESKYGKRAAECIISKFDEHDIVKQDNQGRETYHDQIIRNLGIEVYTINRRR